MTSETLGPYIRDGRKMTGLTIRQLGAKSGVSCGFIYKIEAGRSLPRADKLAGLARALGLRKAELSQVWIRAKEGIREQ